jgi:hypothetical protein
MNFVKLDETQSHSSPADLSQDRSPLLTTAISGCAVSAEPVDGARHSYAGSVGAFPARSGFDSRRRLSFGDESQDSETASKGPPDP